MFKLFLSHHQGACYMVQQKNNVYIIKIQLFTLVFFSFNLPCVKITNKILKMFCCLTSLYVVVCVSRDGCLRTQFVQDSSDYECQCKVVTLKAMKAYGGVETQRH